MYTHMIPMIDLIRMFRMINPSVNLYDAKIAVDAYIPSKIIADLKEVPPFIKYACMFSRNMLAVKNGTVVYVQSEPLTCSELHSYVSAKVLSNG